MCVSEPLGGFGWLGCVMPKTNFFCQRKLEGLIAHQWWLISLCKEVFVLSADTNYSRVTRVIKKNGNRKKKSLNEGNL